MKTSTLSLTTRIMRSFEIGCQTRPETAVSRSVPSTSAEAFDLAVEELLAAGLLRATVIDGREDGHGLIPALTTLPLAVAG